MTELQPQRRGRRIAMSDAERDDFLTGQRTCRVATVSADGPHATPLWFAWDVGAGTLWLHSLTRSKRWADLHRDPRIGVVVDAGEEYLELRGVEIAGRAEPVGEVPRIGEPDPQLVAAETEFARKYLGGGDMLYDGKHAWLRVVPDKIVSWDFRKL